MVYRAVLISSLICGSFFIGFAIRGQAQAPNQGVPDRAYQLAGEKMEVSKLDWIMLTARVRLLETVFAHESGRPASAVGMSYDRDEKRVVVRGFVDSDWVANAKVDELKKVLLKQGTDYCVDGLMLAEAETGEILAGGNVKADCSVHFFTWTTGKDGTLTTKDIAVAEGGQLILK